VCTCTIAGWSWSTWSWQQCHHFVTLHHPPTPISIVSVFAVLTALPEILHFTYRRTQLTAAVQRV
jgi:hypothetical protein